MDSSKRPNYVCIFPNLLNFQLIKDVGMIPYTMAKYFNYNALIVTYNNDKYSYLDQYMKDENFNLNFIKKRFNNQRYDIIIYLILKSRNIDILQVFHFHDTLNMLIYFLIYKSLNRNGKIYAKLDADYNLTSFLVEDNGFWPFVRNFILKYLVDCLSVETDQSYQRLINSKLNYAGKLICMHNGFDILLNGDDFKIGGKKNYITTVGRLGSKEKATEILLEAFSKIKNLKNWKLILIGEFEEQFQDYVCKYFKKYPHLREKVIFTGFIEDRKKIYQYYSETKIFCFTSRRESFGIALVEAAYFGDYLVSTDVGGAKDVLKVTNYGELIEIDNVNLLANRLGDLIENWQKYENDPHQKMNLIEENFSWPHLCKKLYKKINE
jgi:glycosyltransferase involved in cell wall biosynthesis